jgi:hypothetical protein
LTVASRHIYSVHAEYSYGIVERKRFATVNSTIETCGGVEVLAHVLLIYGTIWACVSCFAPRLPYPTEKVMNFVEKSLLTLPGIEPRFLSRSAGGLVTMRTEPRVSVTERRKTKLIMCTTGVMWYLVCICHLFAPHTHIHTHARARMHSYIYTYMHTHTFIHTYIHNPQKIENRRNSTSYSVPTSQKTLHFYYKAQSVSAV